MSRTSAGRSLMASAICVLLGGCAVGPDFTTPAKPPLDRYTAAPLPAAGGKQGAAPFVAAEEIPTRWWAAFHSAPLDRLIRAAVTNNPSLQAADAALKLARYNALAQRGLYFPQVGASY
ncbi:TolC family protein, partial [Rhodopseudomonas sp. B29]|uniref:TolC family protein n=1 Tax=Rhodopseudomonas sp. B29 TaxID=95607 RepID=UPI0004CF492F